MVELLLLRPRPRPQSTTSRPQPLASPLSFLSTQLSHSFELCLRPVATTVFLLSDLSYFLFCCCCCGPVENSSCRTKPPNFQPPTRARRPLLLPNPPRLCIQLSTSRTRWDGPPAGCVTCHADVWIVRGLPSVRVLSSSTSGFFTLLDSVCPWPYFVSLSLC